MLVAGHPLAAGRVERLLVKFALPSIIAMLVGALYNIVDQIFIGRGVGMLGNAATNVAFPVFVICMSVALLMAIGGASNFNLELGRGNRARAAQIVGGAITFSALSGLVIMLLVQAFLEKLLLAFGATPEVLPYAVTYTRIMSLGTPFMIMSVCVGHLIRGDGSPRFSMACNLSGALLNTVLDPIFIFKFDMGIAGAAWATVISMLAGWLLGVFYVSTRFKSVILTKSCFVPRLGTLKQIAALGSSACFNQMAMMCVQVAMNNILTHYGAHSVYGGNIPLAVSGIINKVNMIFLSIVIGLAQGGQPIISFNYGAGNFARVRRTFGLTLGSSALLSMLAFAAFQIFPREIIGLFGSGSEEYYRFAERYFRIFLFMTVINGIQPVTANFFTSIGKAVKGFFISLTRQILFLLPLIMIFPRVWGLDGVMYAGPLADLSAAALAAIFITREMRGIKRLELDASKE
ncbi:MAG: MATE family efflux transporter [Synergistaceae bacterium]|jgi:Na+-driven multidrug efflux pump|nr:MATE family efflux transporter [Synergistaceae bacterium]